MRGPQEPWPLNGRLDQRDERLKIRPSLSPYGCAFMIAAEVGRYLADPEHNPASPLYIDRWSPLQIIAIFDEGVSRGFVRESDAYMEDWDDTINLAAGRRAVQQIGDPWHKPADYPYSPDEIVISCYERQDIDVGKHFCLEIPHAEIQYDPLSSAEPGLSWSRKLGIVVSKRAFRILR